MGQVCTEVAMARAYGEGTNSFPCPNQVSTTSTATRVFLNENVANDIN